MKNLAIPIIAITILFSCKRQVFIEESIDEGMAAFRIVTPSGTYFYQKEAGGFSSILDIHGNDWIGYTSSGNPSYPASAASDYRGLPNLVFRGDHDGAGHPGFSRCNSIAEGNVIISQTTDSRWKWKWEFFERYAVLTMLKTDTSGNYWFLYEGTPGGKFSPGEQAWGTARDGIRSDIPDYFRGLSATGNWKEVFFSDHAANTTFFLNHLTPDTLTDIMGYLGSENGSTTDISGMVVFGFGRNASTEPLFSGPGERFMMGLYPRAIRTDRDHVAMGLYLESLESDFNEQLKP